MSDEPDTPSPAIPDHAPVLRDIVTPGDIRAPDGRHLSQPEGLSHETLTELADTLQVSIIRELNYAIDGAVYERLQAAMEDVASSVKENLQQQLEHMLPDLVHAAVQQQLKHKEQ